MSSAILYVAIVAIWAGVLIPRWLRRDSAAGEHGGEELTTAETAPGSFSGPGRGAAGAPVREAAVRPARVAARPGRRRDLAPEGRADVSPQRELPRAEVPRGEVPRGEVPQHEVARDGDRDHKKVLAARRRLLGMLAVLTIGSGALAFNRMAAWWVVVPPTVMLLGYLVLLHEAAKADADRQARACAVERAAPAAAAAARAAAAAARRAAPPVPAAPAPDAQIIALSPAVTRAGKEFYDQYADAKRRAVGDLGHSLAG